MNPSISPTFEQTSIRKRKPVLVVVMLAVLAVAVILFPPFTTGPIAPGSGPSREHTINGAYLYQQQRSLSCEYASAAIAATMAGHPISEYDFDARVPLHKNPHVGYRGNIHGTWDNTTDYGVYNGLHDGCL